MQFFLKLCYLFYLIIIFLLLKLMIFFPFRKFTHRDFHRPKRPFACRIFRVSQSKIYWWQRVPQLSWVFLSLEWGPFASLVVQLDSNIPTWKLGSNQSHLSDLQMHLKIIEGKSLKLISDSPFASYLTCALMSTKFHRLQRTCVNSLKAAELLQVISYNV